MNLLHASSRVAFAAMIHDLGKFAQRADLHVPQEQKETSATQLISTDKNMRHGGITAQATIRKQNFA